MFTLCEVDVPVLFSECGVIINVTDVGSITGQQVLAPRK